MAIASTSPVLGALAAEVLSAHERVYTAAKKTRLLHSEWLSTAGTKVSLKLENEQVTGAFKIRGATNKIKAVSDEGAASGVVTASSGNHALAVLTAVNSMPTRLPEGLTIYLSKRVNPGKAAKLQALGASLVYHGVDPVGAEDEARRVCRDSSRVYVSPYNDIKVAGGQGTIGLELLSELPAGPLRVYIPVGGGGLCSGIAAALKRYSYPLAGAGGGLGTPQGGSVQVVGCQPAHSNVMQQSVAAGRILDLESEETLSDGTAGGVEAGALTLEACQALVDEWVSVPEEQIAHAMLGFEKHHGARIEGAAGVAVAAYLAQAPQLRAERVVIIICGGNVSDATWQQAVDLAG